MWPGPQIGYRSHLRQHLAENFEPLAFEFLGKERYSRDVCTRMVQAFYKTKLHGVATKRDHDRNGRGRSFCCQCRDRSAAQCHNNRDLTMDQIGCKFTQSIGFILGKAMVDSDILTLYVSCLR